MVWQAEGFKVCLSLMSEVEAVSYERGTPVLTTRVWQAEGFKARLALIDDAEDIKRG